MVIRELLTKFGIKVDQNKVDQFNKTLEKGKAKVDKVDRALTEMGAKAEKTLGKIGRNVAAATKKFDKMVPAINNVGKSGTSILGRLDTASTKFNTKMESSFGHVLGPLRNLSKQIPIIGGMLGGLTPTGIAATVAILGVVKAVRALSAATRTYLNFEMGMKSVQRVTLATAEDMGQLKDAALGAAEASIFTVSQAADAEKFLAQAGLEVDQVIGALPGTLQLAAAANMDLGRAADIATDIMSAQGLAVNQLTRINDTLIKSANLATTTVEGLGSGFATVGSEARRVGLDIETIGGSLGILAKAGQKNELGGTLLRNMLADVKRSKFKKAAERVGIQVGNYVDEATGKFTNFEGLIQAIGKLSATDLNTLLESGFAQASRGKRALGSLVLMSDELVTNIQKIRAAGGVAEQASSIAFTGLSGSIARLGSLMDRAAVGFMEDSGLADLFTNIVKMTSDVLPPLIRGLGLVISPIVRGINLLTVPLKFMSKLLGGTLRTIVNLGSKTLKVILTFFTPITTLIDRVLAGIDKVFDRASSVKDGPMSGWLDSMQSLADAFAKWSGTLLDRMDPLLGVFDVILNLLLFDIPKATDRLYKKLDKMAEDSVLWKVVRFLMPSKDKEKFDAIEATRKASPTTSGGFGMAEYSGVKTGAEDADKEKKNNLIAGIANKIANIKIPVPEILTTVPAGIDFKMLQTMQQPAIAMPGGGIFTPSPGNNVYNSSADKKVDIRIAELKTEVNMPGPDSGGVEIATEINEQISSQLRELLAEGL